jgi:hypothetical protein
MRAIYPVAWVLILAAVSAAVRPAMAATAWRSMLALAVLLSASAAPALAGFTTPEDVFASQTLTLRDLTTTQTFILTEPINPAGPPSFIDVTISDAAWATVAESQVNFVDPLTRALIDRAVFRNVGGAAHILFGSDVGGQVALPDSGLPTLTVPGGVVDSLNLVSPSLGVIGLIVSVEPHPDPGVTGVSDIVTVFPITPTPEPNSAALAGIGLVGLLAWYVCRRRPAAI